MKVPEAKIFVKALVEQGVPQTPCLIGSMGIGKSQIIAQITEELGIGIIDLRLAQMETGDLVGIPYLLRDKTFWGKPGWWPEEGTKGVLFLDEINRAPNDVRQAVFQLILADSKGNRRLHTHVLPKGWSVVAAMNPDNGEYQVETLDIAMQRRFIMLEVMADVESWLMWAKTPVKLANGKEEPKVDPAVTSFIAANKNLLCSADNSTGGPKATPDGWRLVSDVRRSGTIAYESEFEIIAGIVGKEAATAFRKWLDANYQRPVNGEEVLNKYDDVSEKLHKQRNDEWYATKLDLLTHLANNKDLNKKQTENLKRFIKEAPADIQAAFVQGLPPELMYKLTKDDDVLEKVARNLKKAGEGK